MRVGIGYYELLCWIIVFALGLLNGLLPQLLSSLWLISTVPDTHGYNLPTLKLEHSNQRGLEVEVEDTEVLGLVNDHWV